MTSLLVGASDIIFGFLFRRMRFFSFNLRRRDDICRTLERIENYQTYYTILTQTHFT